MEILSLIKSIQFLKEPIAKILALFKLKTENDVLRAENDSLKEKLKESEYQRCTLEDQITEEHNNPLTFDEKTGTWIGSIDSLRYCAKCKTQDILSPLKVSSNGWDCPSCNMCFTDPDRTKSRVPRKPANWRTA